MAWLPYLNHVPLFHYFQFLQLFGQILVLVEQRRGCRQVCFRLDSSCRQLFHQLLDLHALLLASSQHLVPVLRVAGHHLLRRHLSYFRNNCQGPLLYLCLAQPYLLLGTKVRSDTILMTKPSYPEVDKCLEIPVHFVLDGVSQGVHRGIKAWGHLKRFSNPSRNNSLQSYFPRHVLSILRNHITFGLVG